jgi:wobble nucleotide-excising tRNase
MIEKVIKIENIGRFRNCNPTGDVAFKKLNLVFAENGRGKTTLCGILRSLQTGRSEYVTERKTIDTPNPSSVQMRINGMTFTFKNHAWSGVYSDIVIYDGVFISGNVYSGECVDHEQKRNLYRVIIGSNGVDLAVKVDNLDRDIRDVNKTIKEIETWLSSICPAGVQLNTFLALKPVENIDELIRAKTTETNKRKAEIAKAKEILDRSAFSALPFPELPDDFTSVLSTELADISNEAESRLRQQIDKHRMGTQGETWLSQGLEYIQDDCCPFCEQKIDGNTLISAYRMHFNAAYGELKAAVAKTAQQIEDSIGKSAIHSIHTALMSNQTHIEFWKQFIDITLPQIDFDDVQKKYGDLYAHSIALATMKKENPTTCILLGDEFQSAFETIQILRNQFFQYNTAVESSNLQIQARKDLIQRDGSVNLIENELNELLATQKRYLVETNQECEQYKNQLDKKKSLEREKENAKERLRIYCSEIIPSYEKRINSYLDQFNTGFSIAASRSQFTGGTPSVDYQIKINRQEVALGNSKTTAGTPSFRTALSSGDRSALALAFFLASLDQAPSLDKKIVVLDDPFASQDRFRRTCTQQIINQLSLKAEQVIVLSHDPFFLKILFDNAPNNETKCLQIPLCGTSSSIMPWDIEAETQSTYLKDYSTLLSFYRDRTGKPNDVVRSIRPFIEGFLRSHYPGHFLSNEWLGDFIGKIQNAIEGDGLFLEQPNLNEYEAINNYSKKYHHSTNPNMVSVDELHGFVKRTIRLVGGC